MLDAAEIKKSGEKKIWKQEIKNKSHILGLRMSANGHKVKCLKY